MRDITVDVCIPVHRPDASFRKLLQMLRVQDMPVRELYIVNTERQYWDTSFEEEYPGCRVSHIEKKDFDHGGTRRAMAEASDADVLVYMTQDAVPADAHLIRNLLQPILESGAAASYGRQLPREDCSILERHSRLFNYPPESRMKSSADLETLGIKTFFCSNVCAAYDHSVMNELGGFERKTIFNEDMILAGRMIEAGYSVAYAADAKVIHSHNYTNRQQFRRNFDLAVSQAQHSDLFEKYPSEGEGMKLVRSAAKYVIKKGRPLLVFPLAVQTVCKYAGYRKGKKYRKLSRKKILKYTMNPDYWEND